jgi:hypothetical protein
MLDNEIGAAARREYEGILDELLWPVMESLLNNRPFTPGMSAICLDPGSAKICMRLSNYLGPEGHLLVKDGNHIGMPDVPYPDNLSVFTEPSGEWDGKEVDFIIGRRVLNAHARELEIMESAIPLIKQGGFFVLSGFDLPACQCFPENYAFDRYIELLHAYGEILGVSQNPDGLIRHLRKSGFEHLSISSLVPSFLEHKQRALPSLVLEALGSALSKQGLSTPAEVQALLLELRLFGNEPGTLISAPSGYLISASRL